MHRLALAVILLGGAGVASAEPATKLVLGKPTVSPGLAAPAVRKVLKRSTRQLLACYQKARAKMVPEHGTATATFTIGSDGKVTTAAAVGLSMELETCIAATITKLRFARPKGGSPVEVVYPLTYDTAAGLAGFVSLTGTGDLSDGLDDTQISGSLVGTTTSGGFGVGGGGTGTGTIGVGRYGSGSGGSGYGVGRRDSKLPPIAFGAPAVAGALDVDMIRRVVKRQTQKLQHCYEQELVRKPTLQGTVTMAFTIGPAGRVTSATASGLGDTSVESCMTRVFKGILFPKPKTGVAVVTFPLTLEQVPPAAPAPAATP